MINELGDKIFSCHVTAYHIFYRAVCAFRTFRQFLSVFPTGIKTSIINTSNGSCILLQLLVYIRQCRINRSIYFAFARVERSSYG